MRERVEFHFVSFKFSKTKIIPNRILWDEHENERVMSNGIWERKGSYIVSPFIYFCMIYNHNRGMCLYHVRACVFLRNEIKFQLMTRLKNFKGELKLENRKLLSLAWHTQRQIQTQTHSVVNFHIVYFSFTLEVHNLSRIILVKGITTKTKKNTNNEQPTRILMRFEMIITSNQKFKPLFICFSFSRILRVQNSNKI